MAESNFRPRKTPDPVEVIKPSKIQLHSMLQRGFYTYLKSSSLYKGIINWDETVAPVTEARLEIPCGSHCMKSSKRFRDEMQATALGEYRLSKLKRTHLTQTWIWWNEVKLPQEQEVVQNSVSKQNLSNFTTLSRSASRIGYAMLESQTDILPGISWFSQLIAVWLLVTYGYLGHFGHSRDLVIYCSYLCLVFGLTPVVDPSGCGWVPGDGSAFPPLMYWSFLQVKHSVWKKTHKTFRGQWITYWKALIPNYKASKSSD